MDINNKDERRELLDAVTDVGRMARDWTSCSSR